MAAWPSVGHVYARVAGGLGVVAEPERLTRQFVNAWRTRGEFDYSREGWMDLVRHSFHGMAEVSEQIWIKLVESDPRFVPALLFQEVVTNAVASAIEVNAPLESAADAAVYDADVVTGNAGG